MIGFRYFAVSLASVFLALAVGVALGAGPLEGGLDEQLRADVSQLGKDKDALRTELTGLRRSDTYRDSFTGRIAPNLVNGRLAKRTVVLVALPGADEQMVADLTRMVTLAGGTAAGTVYVEKKWVRPAHREFLQDLSKRLASGKPALQPPVPDSGSAYQRAGRVLARALVTGHATSPRQPASPGPGPAPSILGAYGEGGLVDARTDLPRADLAVVVAPPASALPSGPGPAAAATEAWLALARALDEACGGVVVAGDRSSPAGSGVVAAVREDAQARAVISSVDVADLPSGQVAVVLALDEQRRGSVGHYGLAEAVDGPLPTPAAAK